MSGRRTFTALEGAVRILAVTTAGAGHFAGLLPFARACVRAGRTVRVAAPASFGDTVEGAGFTHEPLADADPAALGAIFGRIPTLSMHEADDLVVREVFGRLDRDAALPAMRAVLDDWQPDVVLREPAEVASYVAATERGIPHVQTNIGLSVLDDRLLPLLDAPLREAGCSLAGLAAAPRWTMVPPSFDVPSKVSTGAVLHARDPALGAGPAVPLPDWWSRENDRPLVYATFGSVAAGIGLFPGFYARVVEQLAEVPARVLLTIGESGDPDALGALPPHVHVERWWPQSEVMPHAAVVVGHGGFGTTQTALAAAVPQVVLPLFSFDQFLNADRVAAVGVGLALIDGTAAERRAGDLVPRGPQSTDRLGTAVLKVLTEPPIARAADSLAAEVRDLPDVGACVASLDELAG
jgi:UDP:flavonoid glycosyltransferase YjiC (YdhE family)